MGDALLHPRLMPFGPGLWRGPRSRPAVALTFDDGPHPYYTPRIARVLEAHGARATFFCIGRELARHPALARELCAAGHQLENHTYSHGTGADLFSAPRLVADLRRCQDALHAATGARARYYRPAVGIRNPVVHAAARELGLTVVTWSDAARDGAFPLSARATSSRCTTAAPTPAHPCASRRWRTCPCCSRACARAGSSW